MIVDKLSNSSLYNFGDAWTSAFEFLSSLNPDSDEMKYGIIDNNVFARVMSYHTREPSDAIFEAHQKYIDIQSVLIGSEGIRWNPQNELKISQLYDVSKDVEYYEPPSINLSQVNVFPDTFVMLFPHDAHMPTLVTNNKSELIKKVVIKIAVELISQ